MNHAHTGEKQVQAKLLLTSTPPRGFNSFDSYGGLNHTKAIQLADILAEQLLPHGYEYLVMDGGWSSGKSCVTFPNGSTAAGECIDEFGRPVPDPERFPDMRKLAEEVKSRGLKLGLWTIRGVHQNAVAAKARVKGTQYTVDELVDIEPVGGGANGSCLWAHEYLGVNMSHPAAQAFYDSRVDLLASYGM